MDLSHMIALWLAGQSPGVAPGGVAVVYAPSVAEQGEGPNIGGKPLPPGWVYPFSAGRLGMLAVADGRTNTVQTPTGKSVLRMRAGLGLVGELEYGPEGLARFVPRLWSAVQVPSDTAGGTPVPPGDGGGLGGGLGAAVNRGLDTIGLSDRLQFVDRFDAEGVLGRARVVGFVEHDGQVVQTYEDVAVASFPVMFGKLVDYLRFQVAAQVEGNGYDDLAGALAKSDQPAHAVVIVGAASLSGEAVSIESGDVCHSVVYDPGVMSADGVRDALLGGDMGHALNVEGVSWLRQVVE